MAPAQKARERVVEEVDLGRPPFDKKMDIVKPLSRSAAAGAVHQTPRQPNPHHMPAAGTARLSARPPL